MRKSILTIILAILTSSIMCAQQNIDKNQRIEGPPTIKQIFKDLDTNEDGKISLKEAKGPLKTDFKKVDTNEDGFISKKEMKKAPKPARPEKRENKK